MVVELNCNSLQKTFMVEQQSCMVNKAVVITWEIISLENFCSSQSQSTKIAKVSTPTICNTRYTRRRGNSKVRFKLDLNLAGTSMQCQHLIPSTDVHLATLLIHYHCYLSQEPPTPGHSALCIEVHMYQKVSELILWIKTP